MGPFLEDKKTILIVDDEKPIVDILVYNLEKEGYITIQGRISKAYLFSKVYGAERKEYASVQR